LYRIRVRNLRNPTPEMEDLRSDKPPILYGKNGKNLALASFCHVALEIDC
jgi:hypothetical protein